MHVCPSFTVQNCTDSTPRHAVLISKLLLGHSFGSANRSHLILCQLRKLVGTAGWTSSFRIHVPDVVRLAPKKQVFRVHASAIVTTMQYLHAPRYRTIVEFVRNSMGELAFVIHSDLAIANRQYTASPVPALRLFINRIFGRKGCERSSRPCHISTRLRTESTISFINPITRYLEWGITTFARAGKFWGRHVTLRGHGSYNLSCRAGSVRCTARLCYFLILKPILPHKAVLR